MPTNRAICILQTVKKLINTLYQCLVHFAVCSSFQTKTQIYFSNSRCVKFARKSHPNSGKKKLFKANPPCRTSCTNVIELCAVFPFYLIYTRSEAWRHSLFILFDRHRCKVVLDFIQWPSRLPGSQQRVVSLDEALGNVEHDERVVWGWRAPCLGGSVNLTQSGCLCLSKTGKKCANQCAGRRIIISYAEMQMQNGSSVFNAESDNGAVPKPGTDDSTLARWNSDTEHTNTQFNVCHDVRVK